MIINIIVKVNFLNQWLDTRIKKRVPSKQSAHPPSWQACPDYMYPAYWLKIQSNLSTSDTLEPSETVLIIEVSLFQRAIYTHLYCSGTTVNCPYYRGVLISECPQ